MNPKYFAFIGTLLAVGLTEAADLHLPVDSAADLTANVQITANTDAGKKAIKSSLRIPTAKIQIISDDASIPTGVEVKHVKISPGKKVVISVDPCDDSSDPSADLTVIPQNIEAAVNPITLSPGEQELADQLDSKKSIYDEMNAADLEEHMRKVIEFFDLVKQAGNQRISKKITAPQLALLGESDELKRNLIEPLTGIKSEGSDESRGTSFYSMPVKYKLVKNDFVTAPIIKVNDKVLESGNLFKTLDAIESSGELVEVEIQSANVSSLIFVDLPERMPGSFKKTYLEHWWNLSIAIGSNDNSFDEWETLKFARSFDDELKRIFTFGASSHENLDQKRVKALALGLQESFPNMKKGRMFYSFKASESVAVCQVAHCGEARLIAEMQRKYLKIWSMLRPAAVKIIQSALEGFESRIRGHDEFEGKVPEDKWKELIEQVGSVLNENLLFLIEERGSGQTCTTSLLDGIKESIFSDSSTASTSAPTPTIKVAPFNKLFANFQMEISRINPIPTGLDEAAIQTAIEELRNSGPKQKTISELGSLLFTPQIGSLNAIKKEFQEKVQENWTAHLQKALESKFSLEPYDALKAHIKSVSGAILQGQIKEIDTANRAIDEADETSKWIFNFFNSKSNGNIWIEMMKAASTEQALETFFQNARQGFANICNAQASLQVRLVIDKLLTRKTLQLILKEAESLAGDKAKLTAMSDDAKEKIAKTKELIAKLKEALQCV